VFLYNLLDLKRTVSAGPEGRDSFGTDPPNATLSVDEPGRAEQTLVAITIMKPVVDGADLLYTYKIVEGTMLANGGATSHRQPRRREFPLGGVARIARACYRPRRAHHRRRPS
jgi:hypothetical protein